jgi:Bacterial Ig domain
MGALDSPLDHDAVSGSVTILGWAFDNIGVARVRAYLDSQPLGRLLYGQYFRPDVDQAWPGMGQQVGFAGTLPLHGVAPGAHQLRVEVIDRSGNRLSLGPRIIQIT